MSHANDEKGRCLCSAVQVIAKKSNKEVGVCHCSMCRKWSGGPFLGVDLGADVAFEGKENISVFDSSEWAERGFCSKCGTHLFYRMKQTNQYFVPIGLFENAAGLVLDHQIFIDEKPDYYSFAEKTSNMTGAEVFAQFSGTA